MTLTLPLWLLRGLSLVLFVGCVVLVVGLLLEGWLRERRTLRDLAGLQEAFGALRVSAPNPLHGRSARFHELLVLRMSRNVSGRDAETLVRWCAGAWRRASCAGRWAGRPRSAGSLGPGA